MIPTQPEDRDVLAGEYVLGLLDSEAAAEVAHALASDADLARRVTFWEEQLLPAVTALEPAAVDGAIWSRIERELSTRRHALEAVRRSRGNRRSALRRAWASPAVWRVATALATAAAVLLAILPIPSGLPTDSPTRYFAILQGREAGGGESGPGWLIRIAENGAVQSVPLADVRPATGQSLQLWTLWDQARGPISLGVLPPGGAARLPRERLEAIGNGQLFEITLEPASGSPTGRPTGRVLFIGRARGAETQAL